jgi:hypothetical protein
MRRLRTAVAPTALDPALLAHALATDPSRLSLARLRAATERNPAARWESGLLAAFAEPDAAIRSAMVNEHLTELDARTDSGARVPRVCASIATSAGFFFGSIWLLGATSTAVDAEALMSTLAPALDAVALGIAGMSFCAAIHMKARAARLRRTKDTDGLLTILEALSEKAEGAAVEIS